MQRLAVVTNRDDVCVRSDAVHSLSPYYNEDELNRRSFDKEEEDKENHVRPECMNRENSSNVSATSKRSSRSENPHNSSTISHSNQFWTTLVAHAASAAMAGNRDEKTKEAAANAAATVLLEECQSMERMNILRLNERNAKPPVKVTHRAVRDAAARAAVAVLRSSADQEAAASVASAIIKEGWSMLGSSQNMTKGKKNHRPLVSPSNGLSTSKSILVPGLSRTEKANVAANSATNNFPKSSSHADHITTSINQPQVCQEDSFVNTDNVAMIGSAGTEESNGRLASAKKNYRQTNITRSHQLPAPPSQKVSQPPTPQHKLLETMPSKSIGQSGNQRPKSFDQDQKLSHDQSCNIDAAVDAIHTAVKFQLEEEEKLERKDATFMAATKTLRNKLDELDSYDRSVDSHSGSQESCGNSSNSRCSRASAVKLQLEEEEKLERKHAAFMAATERLRNKLDELESYERSVASYSGSQESYGNSSNSKCSSVQAIQQRQQAVAHMPHPPQHQCQEFTKINAALSAHNSNSSGSKNDTVKVINPNGSGSAIISASDSISIGPASSARSVRSALKNPSQCFTIIESKDDDESPSDDEGTIILSVGECHVQTKPHFRKDDEVNYALQHGDDNKGASLTHDVALIRNEELETELDDDAIEVILVIPPLPPQPPTDPNLKDHLKDFFQHRLKKVTFNIDATESLPCPTMDRSNTDLTEGTHEARSCQYYHELFATPPATQRKCRIPSRHGRTLRKMFKQKLRHGGFLSKVSKKSAKSCPKIKDDGYATTTATTSADIVSIIDYKTVDVATADTAPVENKQSQYNDSGSTIDSSDDDANDIGDGDCKDTNTVATSDSVHCTETEACRDIDMVATKDSAQSNDTSLDWHSTYTRDTISTAEYSTGSALSEYSNQKQKSRFSEQNQTPEEERWAEWMLSRHTTGELRQFIFDGNFMRDRNVDDDASIGTAMTSLASNIFM